MNLKVYLKLIWNFNHSHYSSQYISKLLSFYYQIVTMLPLQQRAEVSYYHQINFPSLCENIGALLMVSVNRMNDWTKQIKLLKCFSCNSVLHCCVVFFNLSDRNTNFLQYRPDIFLCPHTGHTQNVSLCFFQQNAAPLDSCQS